LATKITYVNELANLCEKTGVSIEDVSLGIGLDKRIGSRFLRAGPAFGGSCFPKDTRAVAVTGDLFKTDLSIIKAVIKSNEKRRILLTDKVKKILSNKIKNKKIAFLGVTFKPNTDDMRQSSSLSMIPFLLKRGAKITYYDPSGEKKEFYKFKNLSFCNNVRDVCKNVDLVIIHTEWEEFKALDFKKLYKKKKFKIYDMRNLYSVELMKKKGFDYYSIGR
jgi:UDPglucose 6-dehydrogenase